MRFFIAINFPDPVKIKIVDSIKELARKYPQVFWTKKENLHLTLKFLGNLNKLKSKEEEKLLEIKKGIGKVTEEIKPFTLKFDKLGYFDREQLIIWLDINSDSSLIRLAENIDREMSVIGFPKEKRRFTPHVTVGRGKRLPVDILRDLKSAINNRPIKLSAPFSVKEVALVRSVLNPKGPIYDTEATFPMGF